MTDFEYDIAISYASEDAELAKELVIALKREGMKVFFAPSARAELIGERMTKVFPNTYGEQSRFVVAVLSESYMRKEWTRFELDAAQKEETKRGRTCLLPFRVDDVKPEGLPSDKVVVDLREIELEQVSNDLVERVRLDSGEISPRKAFSAAFREWKHHGFIPGSEKGTLFAEHVDEIPLDIEQCEFLLRCPIDRYSVTQRMIQQIPPDLRVAAGEKMFRNAKTPGFRLSAIGFIGSADPTIAEKRLREIYEDESVPINDRAKAFAERRKCCKPQITVESHALLLDRNAPWELRRAAAINVLWGPLGDDTESVLARAMEDPRREVLLQIVDAIMKFELGDLAPVLMEAYRRDRSRKSQRRIKDALQLFNERQDVVEFGREMKFTATFFKPPSYVHDWEKNRESWP